MKHSSAVAFHGAVTTEPTRAMVVRVVPRATRAAGRFGPSSDSNSAADTQESFGPPPTKPSSFSEASASFEPNASTLRERNRKTSSCDTMATTRAASASASCSNTATRWHTPTVRVKARASMAAAAAKSGKVVG